MLFHDELWKNELRIHRDEIKNISLEAASGDRRFEAERPIYYAAFIVRKLIEDTAVTDRLVSRSIDLQSSPATADANARMWLALMSAGEGMKAEQCFDTTRHDPIRLSIYDFVSEIIHADAFLWIEGAEAPGAFAVASYRHTYKRLLWVPVAALLDVIEAVLADKPMKWSIRRDLQTGKITHHAE